MKAKDIMRKSVVTVASYLTVQELAKVFLERCISGAPVVDSDGNVLGVVSQTDLVRTRRDGASGVAFFHKDDDESAVSVGMHLEEMESTRVEEIMTPGPICFDEETSVSSLAAEMRRLHIHRVLVTRRGRLCGIVTTMDMLRALVPKSRGKTVAGPRKHGRRHAPTRRR
jgi:CBS domain-containing protein